MFHIQAEEISVFNVHNLKVGLFMTPDKEFFVYDFFTGKALFCMGYEHATLIFGGCVNNIKRAIGIGAETNKHN
jgi:hypothetical protein